MLGQFRIATESSNIDQQKETHLIDFGKSIFEELNRVQYYNWFF